jgi:acetylornithine/LysW-gamma-L-lysine aminotransferase
MTDFNQMEMDYGVNLYNKRNLVMVEGNNARIRDIDGKEYIDCTTGHGVASIGHANPAVANAIAEQASKLITCSGSFSAEVRARLMEKLVSIAPEGMNRVFLCNSGAESNEAAIKFARATTGKHEVICAMRGFHGRTMGALSATYNPKYKKDFEPLVPGFSFVPYNNAEKLAEKITPNTAAVLLEVVQGEGGVHPGSGEYFKQVQQLCRENNILLIVDEVQSGFCRTGKMFALEHFDLQPDMVCLAKAIAGGVPMGAVLCSDRVTVSPGQHGTTFGGNLLACAASLAAINFMQKENLAVQAEEKGKYFSTKFNASLPDRVRELRQIGLMIGIELKEKAQPFINRLQEEGILSMAAGATVLRLLPPLTIPYEDLDIVIQKVLAVLNE